jgi:hypothetical protein
MFWWPFRLCIFTEISANQTTAYKGVFLIYRIQCAIHNTKAYVHGWGRTLNVFQESDAYLIAPGQMTCVGVAECWYNYAVDPKREHIEPKISQTRRWLVEPNVIRIWPITGPCWIFTLEENRVLIRLAPIVCVLQMYTFSLLLKIVLRNSNIDIYTEPK